MPPLQSVPFPLGVAEQDLTVAYIGTPDAVEAINLATGTTRWRHDEPLRPLLPAGALLVCWRPGADQQASLDLVWLNAADGTPSGAAEPVELPPLVDVTAGDDFRIAAAAEHRKLVVRWRADTRYRGGAPPPQRVVRESRQRLAGVVTIDLRNGAVLDRRDEEGEDPFPQPAQRDGSEPAATLQLEPGAHHLQRLGTRLYYVADAGAGSSLIARDVESGSVVWQHPLGAPKQRKRPPLRP